MPFPPSDRLIYQKNPLRQVICQVRFPPVLLIEAEVPAEYQERIREAYPFYEQTVSGALEGVPPEIARLVTAVGFGPAASKVAHQFEAADGSWKSTLTSSFLALTCTRYSRWEDFRAQFQRVHDALLAVYRPALLTRIGLRYQDLIVRSELGLDASTPWRELIEPHLAGELGAPEIGDEVREVFRQASIDLPGGRMLTLRHGTEARPGVDGSPAETCYSIDSDFYTEERTDPNDCLNILADLHEHAGRLFRWCITDRLHDRLEPQIVG